MLVLEMFIIINLIFGKILIIGKYEWFIIIFINFVFVVFYVRMVKM